MQQGKAEEISSLCKYAGVQLELGERQMRMILIPVEIEVNEL